MIMGILGWLAVSLLIGFIASKVVNLRGDDPIGGIGAAGIGGIVAAILYTVISGAGVSGFNLWSIMFAAIGAVAGTMTWHLTRSRYVSKAPYTRRSSY